LLGLPRSSYYYEPAAESVENLRLMRLIDQQYLATPFYGSRRMTDHLVRAGHEVNRKRVQRLMRTMGLEGLFPGRKTTIPAPEHKVYPYLLRGLTIDRPDQVWCSDITYVPVRRGYLYLVAVMDWFSRHVLAWRLSNTLEATFCVEVLHEALAGSRPEIFNTDQGAQFTSDAFTSCLIAHRVAISMDGRGRATDNVFIERLWRSVKYEDIYLKDYESGADVKEGLTEWFDFYTHRRPHQGLGGRTPFEVYHERQRT
jgi:putative transposase